MESSNEKSRLQAILPELVLGAVILIWASTFVITKDALDVFTPLSFIFARFSIILLVAFAVLTAQSVRRGFGVMWRVERADLPRFIGAGLLGYTCYQLGFTIGIDHTSPFSSSLMICMMPLYALVIAAVLGERYPAGAWLGVVVAAVGVLVFLLDGQTGGSTMVGNVVSAGGAIALAGYWLINRPLVRKYPPSTVSAFTILSGTIPLLLIGLPDVLAQDWSAVGAGHWLMLLYMAVFPIYLVYIAQNWVISQRGVTATSANLVVPVVSGILSVIVFNEPFGPLKVGGAVIVLVGLIVIQRSRRLQGTQANQAPPLPSRPRG